MGLIISVYRNAEFGDCTNNGVSSRTSSLTVVNVDGPFTPTADRPAVLLERHQPGCLRIVPAVEAPPVAPGLIAIAGHRYTAAPGWHSMGGNYAGTSDSRFTVACEKLLGNKFYGAVAVHDRKE